jgi:GWxTD domain-containing protein
LASDLVLAAGRPSDVGVARVAVGSTTLVDPVWPELTEGSAALRYYLEIYPPDSVTRAPDSLFLWVEDSAGARRVVGPATLAARPRAESALDLRSLPAGRYRFGVALWGGPAGDTTVRWAGFRIAPRVEPADLFSAAGEERLDSLYAPLFHLMAGDERGAYSSLPVDGKRAYLRRFWARRDPTPGTPRNESAETFYARIAYADRVFREGGAAEIPGWRTDRGRIYFLNGAPDEVLRRPQPASTQPYEVWKYTRGRARKYVFFDLTRFGNYTLIYTNDIHEPSRPNWWELLDTEALEEVLRF